MVSDVARKNCSLVKPAGHGTSQGGGEGECSDYLPCGTCPYIRTPLIAWFNETTTDIYNNLFHSKLF